MTVNVKHSSYEDIYKLIIESDGAYTAKFRSNKKAKRFKAAAYLYSRNNGLGWIISKKATNIIISKNAVAKYMTVRALIRKLNEWEDDTMVEISIKDEDGICSWYEIIDIEELVDNSDKEHCLIYAGECVMY